jgi:hypothetical protein
MAVALTPQHVHKTAERLHKRVAERFPDSDLAKVASEVVRFTEASDRLSAELARPNVPLRALTWALGATLVAGVTAGFLRFRSLGGFSTFAELIQGAEAGANLTVLLGAAILSTARLESHLRRKRALAAVLALKNLAHVVDMHQLTKSPEAVLSSVPSTPSSPKRTLSRQELGRYLDYCSEMLSLIGKTAAIYGQRLDDPVVLEAVDSAENLATSLSLKIWQKIAILLDAETAT